jgi:excisionase family DNA binding protein
VEGGEVDGQPVITVAEAAQRLERSTEQVRRYLREGRLTGRRIGGQWFIEEAALEAFLQALREERGFLEKVKPGTEFDPLEAVIGIGHGGGSNIAEGKDAYRRAFWWRR